MTRETADEPGPEKKKRYSLSRAVAAEDDPEWRDWFTRVVRLRKKAAGKRRAPPSPEEGEEEPTPARGRIKLEPKKKKRYTLRRAAGEEGDPEWQAWFSRVIRLRKDITDKRSRFVASSVEKDGKETVVARNRTVPARLDKFVKKDAKKSGRDIQPDMGLIEKAWASVVDRDIAGESTLFAFKNGVLTVSIHSQTLLQEIRQFHQEAILKDLRDIWPASMPLVRIDYKPGQR